MRRLDTERTGTTVIKGTAGKPGSAQELERMRALDPNEQQDKAGAASFWQLGLFADRVSSLGFRLGTAPHTVEVDDGPSSKRLIYILHIIQLLLSGSIQGLGLRAQQANLITSDRAMTFCSLSVPFGGAGPVCQGRFPEFLFPRCI